MSTSSGSTPAPRPATPPEGSAVRRVGAIDCGTNSIRLLVADVAGGREVAQLERRMEIVRLGHGVDRTGRLDPAAIERTLAATREYRDLMDHHGVQACRFIATSATRDASNRTVFTDGVREILGIEPEVVPGEVEAGLSFSGAVGSFGERPGPFLVIDIGGGSTESVLGTADGTVLASYSADMGCVRLTERHLASDPPTAREVASAVREVDEMLDEICAHVPYEEAASVVGVAGSVTTVTAALLGLEEYDRSRVHGAEFTVPAIQEQCRQLVVASRAERRALGFMHPGRADVIGAGAIIWSRLLERVRTVTSASAHPVLKALTSEADILDGIALDLARAQQ